MEIFDIAGKKEIMCVNEGLNHFVQTVFYTTLCKQFQQLAGDDNVNGCMLNCTTLPSDLDRPRETPAP